MLDTSGINPTVEFKPNSTCQLPVDGIPILVGLYQFLVRQLNRLNPNEKMIRSPFVQLKSHGLLIKSPFVSKIPVFVKSYSPVNQHAPWQVGVGRFLSTKTLLFSGSMSIYQRPNSLFFLS